MKPTRPKTYDMNDSERLKAFEQILVDLEDESALVESQIEDMKTKGKTKTATFKQLLARKLTLSQFLSVFKKHGLS